MKSICMLSFALVLVVLAFASTGSAGQYQSTKAAFVDLDLKNVTVEQGLSALFAGTGYKYTIGPGVSGKVVELRLKGVTFEQALSLFTEAAGLVYTISDGVYIISPSPTPIQSTRTIVQQGTAKYAQKPAEGKSVKYPQQVAQAPQAAGVQTPQPAASQEPIAAFAPSQQVVVNQHAPVIYSQPNDNQGCYGYPPMYSFGNMGVIGGCGPLVSLGGYPYVARVGLGALPPPGMVGPDLLRFLRTIYFVTPRMHIFGPGY